MIKAFLRNIVLIFTALVIPCAPSLADVSISGLGSLNLPRFVINTDLSSSTTMCVCSDDGYYSILIQGSGSGGAYTLSDGTYTIPYTVYFNDAANSSGKRQVNQSLNSLSSAYTCIDNPTCSNNNNAYLEVVLTAANLKAAKSGTYQGYISIIVEAN